MPENRHYLSSVSASLREPGRSCVSQIMKPKVIETCDNASSTEPVLEIRSWLFRLVVEEYVLGVTGFPLQTE